MAQRPGRCWYCGKPSLQDGDAPEHVIPAAIQGTLETDRVCFQCNQKLSPLDQQFLHEWWIALPRSEHGIPDRRGNKPPLPRQRAAFEDDTPVRINTAEGWRPEPFPQVSEKDDGTFVVSAATEEEAQRKIDEILKKAGPEATATIHSIEKRRATAPAVSVSVKVHPVLTFRMTIKMALATLSLVWDDSWLDTPQAEQLQTWLHDPAPKDEHGQPVGMVPTLPTPTWSLLCPKPEHLLTLQGGQAAPTTMFCAILLGEHVTGLEIERAGQPQLEHAWWMDGVGGAPICSSITELVARKRSP